MNQELQEQCKEKIAQYRKTSATDERKQLQNELFNMMAKSMFKWTKSLLRDSSLDENDCTVLSISYDAFLHALEQYKPQYPLPSHFYRYTHYYILEERRKVSEEEDKPPLFDYEEDPINVVHLLNQTENLMSNLLFLKDFREDLSDSYRAVFDDALCSMDANRKLRGRPAQALRKAGITIADSRYQEAKKIFRMFISFILKGTMEGIDDRKK